MNFKNHLNQLKRKHDALSTEVEQMQRSPGSNSLKITELKKSKLRLKEKITEIQGEMKGLQNGNRLTAATLPEMTLEALEDNPEHEDPMVLKKPNGKNEAVGLAA